MFVHCLGLSRDRVFDREGSAMRVEGNVLTSAAYVLRRKWEFQTLTGAVADLWEASVGKAERSVAASPSSRSSSMPGAGDACYFGFRFFSGRTGLANGNSASAGVKSSVSAGGGAGFGAAGLTGAFPLFGSNRIAMLFPTQVERREARMPSVTYHVVVPFDRDEDGVLVPGEAKEAPNAEAARRRAQVLATTPPHVGALAFKRTGDPDLGEFQDGEIIAEVGEVDLDALQG